MERRNWIPSVLYEDNHLLVVEKPINLLSQADQTEDADLLSLLKAWLKQRDEKPGQVYLGLVQRLDRPVGGVMVFAKTSKAASRLAEQVRCRTLQKVYLAIVSGEVPLSSGTLTDWLKKDPAHNTVRVVGEHVPQAKQAILHYERLQQRPGKTLLRIQLETGRSHQIRVQWAHAGHPLLGDHKYGLNRQFLTPALWSHQLELQHPTRQEVMRFSSFPPDVPPWLEFELAQPITL